MSIHSPSSTARALIFSLVTLTLACSTPPSPHTQWPWKCGKYYTVTQPPHFGTHRGTGRWGWDVDLAPGDHVTSPVDGIVRTTRGDSRRYGCDASFAADANYVVIVTEADPEREVLLLHLRAGSLRVAPGDHVRTGDPIGQVGRSGWLCGRPHDGAHLHVQLQRRCKQWYCPSVPWPTEIHAGDRLGHTCPKARSAPT